MPVRKTSRFRWVRGNYDDVGTLTFPTTLALSVAGAALGTQKIGKPMAYAAGSFVNMEYAEGAAFFGLLTEEVNADGTTSVLGQRDFLLGIPNTPVKRGLPVTLRVPEVGSEAEFEGLGASSIDNLVATSGGGEELAAPVPRYTELTLKNGCWQIAAAGEWVHALLLSAAVTPENDGETRIRVRFVSPYKAETAGY